MPLKYVDAPIANGQALSDVVGFGEDFVPAITLTQPQANVYRAGMPRIRGGGGYRFRALCAGRRSGKTSWMIHEIRSRSRRPRDFGIYSIKPKIWYIAPTYGQAKELVWEPLVDIVSSWARKINESRLEFKFPNGVTLALRGADYAKTLRGSGLDFVAVDEFADIRNGKHTWEEVIRPMLSDRMGGALIGGTPRGRNHFYELWKAAGHTPKWINFQWTSSV